MQPVLTFGEMKLRTVELGSRAVFRIFWEK